MKNMFVGNYTCWLHDKNTNLYEVSCEFIYANKNDLIKKIICCSVKLIDRNELYKSENNEVECEKLFRII